MTHYYIGPVFTLIKMKTSEKDRVTSDQGKMKTLCPISFPSYFPNFTSSRFGLCTYNYGKKG